MSIGLRIVVALGLATAVLLVAAGSVVGSAVVAGGVARVALHSADGAATQVVVPGALITAVAATGAHLARTAGHGPWWAGEAAQALDPAAAGRPLREMLRVLEEVPDATLVEVEDGGDLVRIDKRRRHLRVRVIDGGGDLDLEISLPIGAARRVTQLLLP